MKFCCRLTEKGSKENSEKLEKKENRPVDDGKADKEDPQKEEEKELEDKVYDNLLYCIAAFSSACKF